MSSFFIAVIVVLVGCERQMSCSFFGFCYHEMVIMSYVFQMADKQGLSVLIKYYYFRIIFVL